MNKWKLIIAAISAGLMGGVLAACAARDSAIYPVESFELNTPSDSTEDSAQPRTVEMIALADTEEEALEIAELYQIELLSFSDGVAVYQTDRDPAELTALGQQNGYPALTLNNTLQLY